MNKIIVVLLLLTTSIGAVKASECIQKPQQVASSFDVAAALGHQKKMIAFAVEALECESLQRDKTPCEKLQALCKVENTQLLSAMQMKGKGN